MGIGSFGEAEGAKGGGDEFEFMLDFADLLTNNDILHITPPPILSHLAMP